MDYNCNRNPQKATNSLLQLLPWGDFIFNRQPQSNWYKLCSALGEHQADFEHRRCTLMHDVLPLNTCELLPDWETTYGLPTACTDHLTGKTERRQALLSHHTATAGLTLSNGQTGSAAAPAYLESLAHQAGFHITISVTHPLRYCRDTYCTPYGCPGVMNIHINQYNPTHLQTTLFNSCTSTTCAPLCTTTLPQLECLMDQYAPARYQLHYHY